MTEEAKTVDPIAPNIGPSLSAEGEKAWLTQEAAVQWHRLSNTEDFAKELTREHNAWMTHVSTCNKTNIVSSVAMIAMALTVIVLAVFVIASLPN